ncbi:MAG TPA: hypothetical protein VG935_04310 [Patescibacteria group bacterium]|nr:hypothetical protein [Patescibacteria group bacterium]
MVSGISVDSRVQKALEEYPSVADAVRALCEEGCSIQAVANALTALGHPAIVRNFLDIPQIRVDGVCNPICWVRSRDFQRSSFCSAPSRSDGIDLEREAAELRGYADPYGW